MNYRYEPKSFSTKKTKIELVQEFKRRKTVIRYPVPDPRDRVDDEYADNTDSE